MKQRVPVRKGLLDALDMYHQHAKDAIGRLAEATEEAEQQDAAVALAIAVAQLRVVLRFLDPEPPSLAESLVEVSQAIEHWAYAMEPQD